MNKQKLKNVLKKLLDFLIRLVKTIHFTLLNYIGFGLIVVALLCILVLTLIQSVRVNSLVDQQLVKRWSDKNDYAQLSLYFPYGTIIDDMNVREVENATENALLAVSMKANSENSQRLYVDSFMEEGSITLQREGAIVSTKAFGIRGDFFTFHPMEFISGGPWQTDSVMKDYVVIDEITAWNLFGATNVAGMNISIGGVSHIISGVIKVPDDKLSVYGGCVEKIAYVSCESLEKYGSVDTAVCYELLMPEPYESFALDTLKTAMSAYSETGVFVDNSKRYNVKNLYNIWKDRKNLVMRTKPIVFPYWENVAHYYEDIYAGFLFVKFIMLMVIIITVLAEIISVINCIKRSGIFKKKMHAE